MMRHFTFSPLTLSVIAFGFAANGQALAQHSGHSSHSIGVGVGVYAGPRPSYGFAYAPFFGYPLYYPGFYGNGISMYGPPVPTYGPVPGTFTGSDNRVNQNAPLIGPGISVGIYGYSVPAARPTTAGPLIENGEPPLLNERALGMGTGAGPLVVEVRLPIENATVFFNGQVTQSNGAVRLFSSPALRPGDIFKYEVRAEWIIDGKKTSYTQSVQGKAGDRVVADFLK